jgi:small-conductance mechanosensitive channel
VIAAIAKMLSWKLVGGLVLAATIYIGVMHVRLNMAQAGQRNAEQAEKLARDANATNMETIADLKEANRQWTEAAIRMVEAENKLREEANEAKRKADKARADLARLRELDRRAPECAAILDSSLAACPDLVRRLWPPDSQD